MVAMGDGADVGGGVAVSGKTSKSYYARVLGTFWRHPRTAGLSLAACGAWVRCLSWCADHRTDGAVPRSVVPMVLGGREDRRAMAELVAAGLLEESDGSLQVRDWSQHNITKEKHEERLAEGKERVARHRGNADKAPSVTQSVTRYTERTGDVRTSLPSDQDQDQDQDQRSTSASDAREGAVELPSSADPTETALRRGYQARYQREARDAWMTHVSDDPWIKRAALWCRQQPRPLEAAERFLDGAFGAGAPPSWRKNRYPWKWLGEDPGRTASFSTLPTGAMGEHETMGAARAAAMAAIPTMDLTSMEGESW